MFVNHRALQTLSRKHRCRGQDRPNMQFMMKARFGSHFVGRFKFAQFI